MLHVAVLLKPYLDMVLAGSKTVECRLTRQACAPFQAIEPGERIYFKQSAGPYGATAIAEQVLFEENLTISRVRELYRSYNHLIRGEREYWMRKKHSRFCTLIWLADLQTVDAGPEIPNLQGRAWLTLDEEPAWRRVKRGSTALRTVNGGTAFRAVSTPNATSTTFTRNGSPQSSFSIPITAGNIRNNTLYVRGVVDRFPSWSIGGKDKSKAARPFTLVLHEGPTVKTDIVGPRNLLRTRVWGKWFREHEAKPGDHVLFSPINNATYSVGLARGRIARSMPPSPLDA